MPLSYAFVPADSNNRLVTTTNLTVDATPDITEGTINGQFGQFPFTQGFSASSTGQPSTRSSLVADTGIPGNFDDGTNGITFSQLAVDFANFPGTVGSFLVGTSLAGFGIKPGEGPIPGIPASIAETPILLFGFGIEFSSFNITLNAPFSSTLTPDLGNPDHYLWAGAADVTLSGVIKPSISVSPQNPDPVPFSIPVQAFPLTGTFYNNGLGGSEVVVGLDAAALADLTENQLIQTDPIDIPLTIPISALGLEETLLGPLEALLGPILAALLLEDIYAELGDDVTVNLSARSILNFDANGFEIHYVNATPVPEPGTAALVGLGCVGLAVARRRKSA